ncbi:MAG TPA: hypothetical protein VME23_11335 [Terracidiphilus sp.]|nr:hypothetical protein [Terracidiphilus sp.]
MFRLLRQFNGRNQRPDDGPLSLWDDIFLLAAGFFSLGVSLFGLLVELGPHFVAGAHVEKTALVSEALIGSIGLFIIVEGYRRIDRTIHHVNERLKSTSALN